MDDVVDFEPFEVVAMTDHQIASRYGEIQVPSDVLVAMADQFNRLPPGDRHMVAHHDPGQAIKTRGAVAAVVTGSDGHARLVIRGEVEAGALAAFRAQAEARGAPGGMSVSFTIDVIVPDGPVDVVVAADAADFDDNELSAMVALAPTAMTVKGQRLYQFAADAEVVRTVVEFGAEVVRNVPVELLASWVASLVERVRERASTLGRPPALDVYLKREPDGSFVYRARHTPSPDEDTTEVAKQITKQIKALVED